MKQGWEDKTLNDIGLIFSGNSINAKVKEEKYLNLPDGMPYVATKDVGYDSSIDYENGIKIPYSEIDLFRIAPKNSVLICAEGGSAGRKIGKTNQDICFVNKLFAITPENETTSKFVYYWYKSETFKNEFKSRLTGLIGGVSKKKFESIPIPIPPLDEQKRIVAKLDELFALIENGKLKVENLLADAKELFQSQLNEIFSQKGDGWVEKKLGEVGKPSMCKRIFKNETSVNGEIPFYKIGTFGKEPDSYISKNLYNDYKEKYRYPKKGDVLISASGTIGRTVIYDGEPAYFQDSNIVWIDNDEEFVTNRYLYNFYKNVKWGESKGATIKRLYNSNLEGVKIQFPISQNAQKQIVNQLDELKSHTQALESKYQQELDALDELKKSILQKAFNGEL